MKILKRIGIAFLSLLVLVNIWVWVSGKSFIYKALVYNYVNIDDLDLFESRTIEASSIPQPWPLSQSYNRNPATHFIDSIHKELRTVAFVVIHQDSLRFETYFEDYSKESHSNSFSMAKSFVGMLIGAAIQDGHIQSVDQPVGDFLEDFNQGDKGKITLKHVLQMSSGLSWDESYSSPFSLTTEAYYGTDLARLIKNLEAVSEPGKKFIYLSGDTQILAMVLEKTTGKRTADYLEEKLWNPIGAEQVAYWSLDKEEGLEKAYCCMYSNARDFARLGKVYMDSGRWLGQQLIPQDYVLQSTQPHYLDDEDGTPVDYYGYQWWMIPDFKGRKIFYARGILGQYIFISPADRLICVRLGHLRTKEKVGKHPADIQLYLEEAFRQAGLS